MNRKQRRAAKSTGAERATGSAAAVTPAALVNLFATAAAHHRVGALADAERGYRHILSLAPSHAETHGLLGVALVAQGKIDEAVPHFEQTAMLKPNEPGAYDDLGKAYMTAGKPELAILAAERALQLGETGQRKAFFAYCAKYVVFTADTARIRSLMLRALVEAWARPRELARACISLIKLDPVVSAALTRADSAWPERVPPTLLFGATGITALSQNELLCRLLEIDPISDLGLERLLTNVRHSMLEAAAAERGWDERLLGFCCSVARQCFINEYVFAANEAEVEEAQRLRAAVERTLAAGQAPPERQLAIVGAYFPLHTIASTDVLLAKSWSHPVDELIVQQVREPMEERRIAPTIPVLTAIDDEVSRAVREQYEQNPYPRWVKAGPPGQPAILNSRQPDGPFDVLIAGCGTGLSATEFARQAHHTRILAVDLSLASLSYAKRMAQDFRLTNIEFAQADILRLGSIDREFDFIDASGVLHHLADPWQGWRVLLSLLRPGGAMEVGLYSSLGRRNVVAARALIAQRGYRPIPADIRRCREEIAAATADSLLQSLTTTDDFFTISECRDLLFHAQEHRLTLPEIKAFLAANNLQFLGFVLPPALLQRFAMRFPERTAIMDLDCWQLFETEAPETFAGMYLFSVRKSASR